MKTFDLKNLHHAGQSVKLTRISISRIRDQIQLNYERNGEGAALLHDLDAALDQWDRVGMGLEMLVGLLANVDIDDTQELPVVRVDAS